MADGTKSFDRFNSENPSYKLEDPIYILEVLKVYYEQNVEDCRIIGNQKYSVLISLSIALGSFIFALTQICASATNVHYMLEGTLKTLYSSTPSTLSFYGNTSSILSESNNVAGIPISSAILTAMILTSLILFIFMFITTVASFIFLMNHLPLMDAFSVEIEELQRDILFKKMRNVDLFSWDEIKTNKSNKFKDYLKQKFILENITSINTKLNNSQIEIDITKNILKKEIKYGTLSLEKEKKVAILTVDGIELDQFSVKEKDGDLKNTDYILYESEMKYRFRNLTPHSNVLKISAKINWISIVSSIMFLGVTFIVIYLRYRAFY